MIVVKEGSKVSHRDVTVCWITGSIGQENPIVLMSDFLDRIVVGVDCDGGSSSNETANYILLDAAIDKSDFEIGSRCFDVERVLSTNLFDQVDFARINKSLILIGIVFLADNDSCKTRAALPEKSDDGTGINTRNSRNARASAPGGKGLDGGPMGVFRGIIGDDNAGALDGGGFKVAEEIVFIAFIEGGDAIVSEEGLSEDEDLAFVGGIGHGFGIAYDGGGEDGFTADVAIGAKGNAVEHGPILPINN